MGGGRRLYCPPKTRATPGIGRFILVEAMELPICQQCNVAPLVPLSDYGAHGAPVHYKAWTCINPGCGYNIKIRNGTFS